jgi:hypothetical protein
MIVSTLNFEHILKVSYNLNTWRSQICDEHVSKFEEPPSDENDSNVGGSNFTPCLIKPLVYVKFFFVF